MNGWNDATQLILQILSNPAWSGVSSLCSLIGIPLAIHLARKSKTTLPTPSRTHYLLKKTIVNCQIGTTLLEKLPFLMSYNGEKATPGINSPTNTK